MAIHINTLNGGDITITTGGSSPAGHSETRFTFSGGQTVSLNISGVLDNSIWQDDETENIILVYDGSEKLFFYDLVSVDIGNTVTSIGASAFYGCDSLTSVTIGNGVTSIGQTAFMNCSGLTSVTIPGGVTSIGTYAFFGCSGLTSMTFQGKTLAQVQEMDNYDNWGIEDTSIINVA